MQRVALDLGQVERAQLLVAVLAAADVVEVGAVGVERLAEAARAAAEPDPAPAAAALEQQQVAAVGVDVHQVRVQRADAQQLRHGGSPPRCRRSPRSRRTRARCDAAEPGGRGLALELVGGQPVEADQVALDGSLARRRDRLAPALEHEPVAIGADRGRLARVHDAVELADVGQRRRARRRPPRTARAPRRSRSRAPRRAQVAGARRPGTRARPSGPPSSWIVCIGTMHSGKRSPRSKSRASATTVVTTWQSPHRLASAARAPRAARGRGRAR